MDSRIETQSEFKIKEIPKQVSLEKFQKFLERYQNVSESQSHYLFFQVWWFLILCQKKEKKTVEECQKLIEKYEPNECKKEHCLSLCGFVNYLNDDAHFIFNTDHDTVYQDMDRPFKDYFISSSHNTSVDFFRSFSLGLA